MSNTTMATPFDSPWEKPLVQYFKQWNVDTSLFPLTHVEYPVSLLLFYIGTVLYFQPARATIADKSSKPKSESSFAQKLGLSLHNLVLCIFSVLCFIKFGFVVFVYVPFHVRIPDERVVEYSPVQ